LVKGAGRKQGLGVLNDDVTVVLPAIAARSSLQMKMQKWLPT
jgi:hypothetical protein